MDQVLFKGCFVCGPDNNCGLHATFRNLEEGLVEGTFTPDVHHCGYEGIVHGGVIMGFLDEVLGRLSFQEDRLFLTHTLEVSFRKASEPGKPLKAFARIVDRSRRQFTTEGELIDNLGDVVATAKGRYLYMNESMEKKMLPDGRPVV
jgi:uncharacterized protein (TIGR00369 family)